MNDVTGQDELVKANAALNRGQLERGYNLAVQFLNATQGKSATPAKKTQALVIAASALMLANKPSEAIKLYEEARTLSPHRSDILSYLARCYLACMRMPEARELCILALKDDALQSQGLTTIGVVLSHCQDFVSAQNAFERAFSLSPGDPELLFNLAAAYKFNGDFNAAEEHYEKAIVLKPDYGQAHAGLAEIPNKERRQERITRLQAIPDSPEINEFKYYSLAREYERDQHYDAAFEAFSISTGVRKKREAYDFEKDKMLFTAIRKHFDHVFHEKVSASNNLLSPIFIVGMPRTGTTLVERILTNHSAVTGLGELKYLPAMIKKHSGSRDKNAINAEVFSNASQLDFEKIAADYGNMVKQLHDCEGIFTDKLPINFLNVGIIRKCFPNAKVIVLRRKPIDTCLSNFRQLFGSDSIHQYYSNSIEDVARYYVEFDKLIAHWKKLFGEEIFELHYETLVEEPETTIRSLIAHCGLEWESSCLNFHKNPSALATASAYQARQPIYKDSAMRAASYDEFMAPARVILQNAKLIS